MTGTENKMSALEALEWAASAIENQMDDYTKDLEILELGGEEYGEVEAGLDKAELALGIVWELHGDISAKLARDGG
jgi:hypothetical protein